MLLCSLMVIPEVCTLYTFVLSSRFSSTTCSSSRFHLGVYCSKLAVLKEWLSLLCTTIMKMANLGSNNGLWELIQFYFMQDQGTDMAGKSIRYYVLFCLKLNPPLHVCSRNKFIPQFFSKGLIFSPFCPTKYPVVGRQHNLKFSRLCTTAFVGTKHELNTTVKMVVSKRT